MWLTDEERAENSRRDAEARQQGYTDAYARSKAQEQPTKSAVLARATRGWQRLSPDEQEALKEAIQRGWL